MAMMAGGSAGLVIRRSCSARRLNRNDCDEGGGGGRKQVASRWTTSGQQADNKRIPRGKRGENHQRISSSPPALLSPFPPALPFSFAFSPSSPRFGVATDHQHVGQVRRLRPAKGVWLHLHRRLVLADRLGTRERAHSHMRCSHEPSLFFGGWTDPQATDLVGTHDEDDADAVVHPGRVHQRDGDRAHGRDPRQVLKVGCIHARRPFTQAVSGGPDPPAPLHIHVR